MHGSSGWHFGSGSPEVAAANEMLYDRYFDTQLVKNLHINQGSNPFSILLSS